MELESAIKVEKAAPDSHFRLLRCPECGSDNVAYVQYMMDAQEPWKVCCFDCGFTVDQQKIFRHEAQLCWNRKCQEMQQKPCMNCPDRIPGCSDHCMKPRFRAWKYQQEQLRAARKTDLDIGIYTAGQIRKNRRVR